MEKIKGLDKNAFTIVSEVREVHGEGFMKEQCYIKGKKISRKFKLTIYFSQFLCYYILSFLRRHEKWTKTRISLKRL